MEEGNIHYKLCDDKETCSKIVEESGIDSEVLHILNRHVPVKVTKGERCKQ